MNVNSFGSLGVTSSKSFTLAFPPAGSPPVDFNPFDETIVRQNFSQQDRIADSHVSADNGGAGDYRWSADLDKSVGRVLRTQSGEAEELQGGSVKLAMAMTFDPSTKQPSTLDMTSESGNMEKHVRWTGDAVTHSVDRRVLADGSKQSVEIVVNPQTGVLTYTQTLEPAPPK